jgi:hypothetical protein
MRYFKILHTSAGPWFNGTTVSEAQIRAKGFDPDAWLKLAPPAIGQVNDPDDAPPAGPAPKQPAAPPASAPVAPPQSPPVAPPAAAPAPPQPAAAPAVVPAQQ